MRRLAPLAAFALLASAGAARAQPTSALGVYSNVRLSPETGDLGGMELELRRGPDGAEVEFVLCEGWCNHAVHVPVTVVQGRFTFDYIEPLNDEGGRPIQPWVLHIAARLANGGVVLSSPTEEAFPPTRLRRRSSRFGLDVANQGHPEAPR